MTITDFADFLRGENLIFLLIIVAIFISIFWAVIIIVLKIFRALSRAFGGSKKRPEFIKNSNAKEEVLPNKSESPVLPKPKLMGGDFVKISPKTPEKQKPEQKVGIIAPKKDFSASAGLAKLKNENPEAEAKPGRYKFFQNSSDVKDQEKTAEEFNKTFGGIKGGEPSKDSPKVSVMAREENKTGVEKTEAEKADFFGNKVLDKKETNKVQLAKKSEDKSLFGGRQEMSRKELKYKLYKDPKAYKAARESLLNMNAIQREKLVKDLFPTVYGSNISKSDVKARMHKLSRKMLSEQNPQAKALLRKEIKFAKKITGVK